MSSLDPVDARLAHQRLASDSHPTSRELLAAIETGRGDTAATRDAVAYYVKFNSYRLGPNARNVAESVLGHSIPTADAKSEINTRLGVPVDDEKRRAFLATLGEIRGVKTKRTI